jgi:hypothetical protein
MLGPGVRARAFFHFEGAPMIKTRWRISTFLCAAALLLLAGQAAAQTCHIPQRFPGATAAAMDYKADLNANLGDWGTIFMDIDTDGCELTARDFLQSKLERQNLDANGWKGYGFAAYYNAGPVQVN